MAKLIAAALSWVEQQQELNGCAEVVRLVREIERTRKQLQCFQSPHENTSSSHSQQSLQKTTPIQPTRDRKVIATAESVKEIPAKAVTERFV